MNFLNAVYPLFFAIFPLLFYYNANRFETTISSLFLPLAVTCIMYGAVYGVLRFIIQDRSKLKITLSLFFLYFLSFVHFSRVFSLLKDFLNHFHLPANSIIVILYSFLFFTLLRVLLKTSLKKKSTGILIIIGTYLLISPLVSIIPWEIERTRVTENENSIQVDNKSIIAKNNKPDIYYIILDRYASTQTLTDYYNFDNSAFTDYLLSQGFYIGTESFTNYPKTHLSLASTLNMEYIHYLTKQVGVKNKDYTPAFRMVQNNKVARIFKSLGYRYIYFGDWWEPTRISPVADENINLFNNSNEFLRKYFTTTVLYPLIGDTLKKADFLGFSESRVYDNLQYKFEKLNTVTLKQSPKFVFAHMLMPHYPYLFDKNCARSEDGTDSLEKPKYIEQLQCTNIKMREVIDSIFKQSKTPPVIIIQSDEGPFDITEMNRSGEGVDWRKASDSAIKTHMRIFNSYYIPDSVGNPIDYERVGFYNGISPVNTFRLLFNTIFDSNLEILEDKSYFIPHLDQPYNFYEITNVLK